MRTPTLSIIFDAVTVVDNGLLMPKVQMLDVQ